MIVCVSPSSKDIDDTHNTLMWANRAKDIKTKISQNTEGVPIRVQQYLDKIATQQRRIDELEAERLAGPKHTENAAVVQRRERDRVEVRQALDGLDAEVEAHLDVINEGAEQRALWDVSQLTVAALEQRIQDLQTEISTRTTAAIERDSAYLRSRVEVEMKNYSNKNAHLTKIVSREIQRARTIDKHIENVSSRSFEDLPTAETEALKVALDSKRKQVDLKVMGAREKGYRQMHRHNANMQVMIQHHIYSQKENLLAMIDQMSSAGGTAAQFVHQLRSEVERSESVLSTAHGHLPPITDALPPPIDFKSIEAFALPPPTPLPQRSVLAFTGNRPDLVAPAFSNRLDLMSPSKHRLSPIKLGSMQPALGRPSPSSSSSLPSTSGNNPFQVPPIPVSKAVARVRGVRPQGTPRRKAPGTPGKRAFAKRSALKPSGGSLLPKLPKTTRWKSDNSITEEKTMSTIQTGSSSENSPGNSSWHDDDDDDGIVSPIKATTVLPKSSLGLPSRKSVTSVAPPMRAVPTVGPPKVLAPITLGSLPTTVPVPAPASAANDWRASRNLPTQKPSGLGTVSEDGPVSPSAIGNTSIPRLAPPAGRPPLGESRMNPTASSSTSRLSMPTAASAAKSINNNSELSISLSAAARESRRESGAHMNRAQRITSTKQYARPSIAHTKLADDSNNAVHPLLKSDIGQPKKRASMMPLNNPSRPGPRESVSASTTLVDARGSLKKRTSMADIGGRVGGGSLASRPSIANIRGNWK